MVEVSLKKPSDGVGGDNSGNHDCEEDVGESTTSPRTRNSRPSPRLDEFSVHPLLARTCIVTMMACHL